MPSIGASVDVLLPAEVVGRGWVASESSAVPPWPWVQKDCPTYRDADYAAQSHRLKASQRSYANAATGQSALHVVETYEPGWAAQAVNDVRRVLRACGRYDAWGGSISFTVLPTPNVCDETLTVRGEIRRPGIPTSTAYFLSVRCGERVSTLNIPSIDKAGSPSELGRRTAERIK